MSQLYDYTALTPSGETQKGTLLVGNKAELLERLLAENLFLLRAKKKSRSVFLLYKQKMDWLLLERLASTMVLLLGARMPLADSLELLVATADRRLATVGKRLLQWIAEGQSLSQAAQAERAVFGQLYPALFALGEATGDMHAVFKEMLHSVRWHRRLKSRVRNLLTYPLMVLLMMSAVFVFLLVSVVPQLVIFVQSVSEQLPWHTLVLFSLSQFMQQYWIQLSLGLSVLAALAWALPTLGGRLRGSLDCLWLKLPILGRLLKDVKFARFFHALAMLSRSGITLLDALETARPLLQSPTLEKAVANIGKQVNSGSLLADAMQHSGVFTQRIWRMVQVGEQSGDLGDIFQHLSDLFDHEVSEQINRIEQFLPTMLIALVGLVLMWMIVSIMGPLYNSVLNAGVGLI